MKKKLGLTKKAELDEDFMRQERITATTKSVTEGAVKNLAMGGGLLASSLGKVKESRSEEEKKGDALIEEGTKLKETCGALVPSRFWYP